MTNPNTPQGLSSGEMTDSTQSEPATGIKGLHGLSPVEDWIRHAVYLEARLEAAEKREAVYKKAVGILGEALNELPRAIKQDLPTAFIQAMSEAQAAIDEAPKEAE